MFVVLCSSLCVMALGYVLASRSILSDAACKGVSALYAKLVFPAMVFKGVALIKLADVELTLMGVVLVAKASELPPHTEHI